MQSLDVLAGGAGVDTLSIVDAVDVFAMPMTLSGIEKIAVETSGSIGAVAAGAAAVPAVKEIDQLSFAAKTLDVLTYSGTAVVATDKITVTNGDPTSDTVFAYNGTAWVASAGAGSGTYTTAAEAVAAALNARVAGSASVGTDGKVYTTNDITGTAGTDAAYNVALTTSSGGARSGLSQASQDADALVAGGKFTVTYAGVTVTTAALSGSPTKAEAAGLIKDSINAIAGSTVASVIGDEVVVTAPTAGTALPTYSITYAPAAGVSAPTFNSLVVKTDSVANVAATTSTEVAASTFGASDADTSVVLKAGDEIVASAATTAAVTATSGGLVNISGGADVTVTAGGSVQLSSGKGAINVTTASAASTGLAGTLAASTTSGWGAGAGVFIRGGTSVNVTVNDGKFSSGVFTDHTDTAIQIGANPTNATGANSLGAVATATATGYPEVIGNKTSAPTGDVSVVVRTTGADTNGYTNVHYGAGAVTAFMNGGATASVTGAGTVSITDINTVLTKASSTADALPGTSKLATVNLTGVSGSTSIKSDAVTAIKAVDTASTITVTGNVGANTGGIALSVANSAVTLVQASATSVSVTGVDGTGFQKINGSLDPDQSSTVALNTAKAASLSFAGTGNLTLGGSTLTELTSITATNSGKLNLGTVGGSTKLVSVDASGATGGVTATYSATNNTATTAHSLTFKGGSGNDTVTIAGTINSTSNSVTGAAATNTIDLGAGNDVVLKGSSGLISAGAVVDGGTGVDTIAASLLNSGNAALIKNFEVIGLDLTSGNYDTDLLVGATGLAALALTTGTYTNVNTNQGLTYGVDLGSSSGEIILEFGTAEATGTSDGYTVTFAGVASAAATVVSPDSIRAQTLVIEDIETVNVVSAGTGAVANSITVLGADATKVVITGDKSLTIGFDNGTSGTFGTSSATASDGLGVATIDASALSGKLIISTADLGLSAAGLTLKGGSNDDTIALTAFSSQTAGNTVVVDAGAGNDTITVSSSNAVLTLGAGKDTVNAWAATGTTSKLNITDAAAGDKIDFIQSDGSTNATSAALGVAHTGSYSTLSAALDGAANAGGSSGSEINWIQWGGKTYVIFVVSAASSGGVDTSDVVVVLDGTLDLSKATFNVDTGLLTFA